MNRIFHARILFAHCLFLLLLTFLLLFAFWKQLGLIAFAVMLLMVLVVERLIHTTYTFTPEGTLLLYYGRFARPKTLRIEDIHTVERASSMRVGRFALVHCVLLTFRQGGCVALIPRQEEEFIEYLWRRMERTRVC